MKKLFSFWMLAISLFANAQNPTYLIVAKNDTLISSKVFQFDVYIYRTGSTDLYLNNFQLGFEISNTSGILNGGAFYNPGTYVSGSCEIPSYYDPVSLITYNFRPSGVSVLTANNKRYIRVNGCTSSDFGVLIPTTGYRIGTFQVTNTNDYGMASMNLSVWNASPAVTTIRAIVGAGIGPATPTLITTFPSSHILNLTNPVLNQPITLRTITGGDYCSGTNGTMLGLSGSEVGIKYQLVKSGITVGSPIDGTGAAFSLGLQTAGSYVVRANRPAHYFYQIANATVSEINAIPSAPTGDIVQSFTGVATVADLIAIGSDIKWYDAEISGNMLLPTELLLDGHTYYASQTIGVCESQNRLAVTVSLGQIKILDIRIFLEGLYAGSGNMNQAQGTSGPQFPAGIADKVGVELHNSTLPYGIFYEVNDIDLHTDGTLQVNDLPANTSGSYYIAIKHRNSIQTWSALPYSFAGAGPFSYDFSTAASQAYGSNQKDMGDGYFAIFTGDVDQDGGISVVDMGLVDNQSAIFGGGYIPEDIDGDGGVSTIDMGLIDNNSAAFVGAVFPGAKKHLVPLNK
jgi:hypothetical protein